MNLLGLGENGDRGGFGFVFYGGCCCSLSVWQDVSFSLSVEMQTGKFGFMIVQKLSKPSITTGKISMEFKLGKSWEEYVDFIAPISLIEHKQAWHFQL